MPKNSRGRVHKDAIDATPERMEKSTCTRGGVAQVTDEWGGIGSARRAGELLAEGSFGGTRGNAS